MEDLLDHGDALAKLNRRHDAPLLVARQDGADAALVRARAGANKAGPFAEASAAASMRPARRQMLSLGRAGGKGALDFARRQRPDCDGDAPLTEIALRVEVASRRALDRGMAGNVDGVGDQRRGGVGERGRSREDGDRVGDAKREAAPSPARRRDAAHAVRQRRSRRGRTRLGRSGPVDHADRERLAGPKMKRDVAAIVDIGAGEPPPASSWPRGPLRPPRRRPPPSG